MEEKNKEDNALEKMKKLEALVEHWVLQNLLGPCDCRDSEEDPHYDEDDSDVNNPDHYQSASGVETIDVIEDFDLNFNLGNVVKYVLRAGKKDESPVQDLKKAMWYLNREIASQEEYE